MLGKPQRPQCWVFVNIGMAIPEISSFPEPQLGSRLIALDQIRAHDAFSTRLEAACKSSMQPALARLELLCQRKIVSSTAPTRLADEVLEQYFGFEGSLTELVFRLILNREVETPQMSRWIAEDHVLQLRLGALRFLLEIQCLDPKARLKSRKVSVSKIEVCCKRLIGTFKLD
eukprot:s2944_g12.t1